MLTGACAKKCKMQTFLTYVLLSFGLKLKCHKKKIVNLCSGMMLIITVLQF